MIEENFGYLIENQEAHKMVEIEVCLLPKDKNNLATILNVYLAFNNYPVSGI